MSLFTLGSPGGNETLYQLFNSMLRAIGLAYTTGTVRALIRKAKDALLACFALSFIEVLGVKRKTLSFAPKTPISGLIAPVAQPTIGLSNATWPSPLFC